PILLSRIASRFPYTSLFRSIGVTAYAISYVGTDAAAGVVDSCHGIEKAVADTWTKSAQFDKCSMKTYLRTSPFFPTRQNTAPDFTGHFAKLHSPRRNSATAAAIRWIPRTRARR